MDGRTDQLIDAVGFRVELHMTRGADLICSASKISNTDGRKVWHASFVVGVISSLFGVRWLLDCKKKRLMKEKNSTFPEWTISAF